MPLCPLGMDPLGRAERAGRMHHADGHAHPFSFSALAGFSPPFAHGGPVPSDGDPVGAAGTGVDDP